MRTVGRLISHLLVAILAGGMISLANAVDFDWVVAVWTLALMASVAVAGYRRGGRVALAAALTYLTVVPGCVLLAAAAPVKTRDRVLARRLVLPRAAMTLAEVQEYAWSGAEPRLPTQVSVDESLPVKDQVIRWPGREMSVAEFVTVVEAQTPLRHRFGGCGNGSSILFGGNCCFGLSFRIPDGPG